MMGPKAGALVIGDVGGSSSDGSGSGSSSGSRNGASATASGTTRDVGAASSLPKGGMHEEDGGAGDGGRGGGGAGPRLPRWKQQLAPETIDLHGMRVAEAGVAVINKLHSMGTNPLWKQDEDGEVGRQGEKQQEEGRRERYVATATGVGGGGGGSREQSLIIITGTGKGMVLRQAVVSMLEARNIRVEVAPEGNEGRLRVTADAIEDYAANHRGAMARQAVVRRALYRGTLLYALLFAG